jgi:hypothetical protein
MSIYGHRTMVRQLALIMTICERCEQRALLQVNRRITKFTMLFIPLLPIRSSYFTRCAACNKSHPLRKETAMQMVARAN